MDYSRRMNRTVGADGRLRGDYTNGQIFRARELDPALDPRGVIRECCDSADHPQTIPVILALDVTGSMGQAAVEVAKQLNVIMTKLYEKVKDVEFMIMGIGDFAYDRVPLQASQFEADIRIAEQLDKIYFEFGGGGNRFESYTAAWHFAAYHTRLDAWKRGKKGILITMGDEQLNPFIPTEGYQTGFQTVTGDYIQGALDTRDLYREVAKKYEIYHLDVNHARRTDEAQINATWSAFLDKKHFRTVTLNSIANEISDIVLAAAERDRDFAGAETEEDGKRRIGFRVQTVRHTDAEETKTGPAGREERDPVIPGEVDPAFIPAGMAAPADGWWNYRTLW